MNKNIFTLLILFTVITGLVFSGCKKDDDEEATTNYYMTAKVDGVDWSAKTTTATYSNNMLSIMGMISSYEHIGIMVEELKEGTFNFGTSNFTIASYTPSDGYSHATSNGGSGEITISSIDPGNKIIEGTFHFIAKDGFGNGINITEGSFRAKY